MKTRYNLMRILSFLLIGTVLGGCSDFLDVTPKDKQTQEQLFATRSGFYAAVNGIYNALASDALYGRNLSYEMLDAIGLRNTVTAPSGSMLDAAVRFDYANAELQATLQSVWETAYSTILNCNVILDNLARQHNVLPAQEARLMKGELLAFRAFLHFDMLRLFGPQPKDAEAPSIPYNESTRITNLEILPFRQVVQDKILRDLEEALQYLDNDPVIENGPMASAGEDASDPYLRYRQLRFNHYAVTALKARVLLYAGERQKAAETAAGLVDNPTVKGHFPAVDPSRLLGNSRTPDRVFSTEVLMGMYRKDRADIFTYSFDPESAGGNFLQPANQYVDQALFVGEEADFRYQSQWEQASTVGAIGFIFTKYKKLAFQNPDNIPMYAYFMPLIRMSEMYYIAAEASEDLTERYGYLNRIRDMRGLPALPVTSEADLIKRIRTEYLREFHGEGQAFFMYKRLDASVHFLENGYNLINTWMRFDIPMPESELMFR